MKPDNWNRFTAGLLAILLCLCSFSMPAFASGSDPAPEPLPEIIEEEPTTGGMEPEGVPITPKGNATLVDDFYGDKQLITVTTKAGNYFYILIDRANEDKETSVHFLNQVDDADLLALLDEEPQDTEFCICTVKCEAGNVNENCPLCEKSLRNCTAPEAVKTDTETPQEKPKSNMGSLMILLVLALAGGGAGLYYFKFRKSKADTTGHDDLDEYDFGEDEDPADFKGHSLSVSDVVVLHQNGQDTAHYCDSVGFQQVPEFLRENPLRTAELSTEQNENMIDGVLNNAPSLGELEAKAKAGEQISLTDLAAAVKAEEKAPKAKESRTAKPKKPSIRAQLDAAKKEQSKQTPPRKKTKELEV